MSDMRDFINGLPKAELHLHIEGSLEPKLMLQLAQRNNVSLPYSSIEEIHQAYKFKNLQEFLDIYYTGMSVLQNEQDFYELTMAYLKKSHTDNVRHVEIFFDPQGHTSRGVPFEVPIKGISNALSDGQTKYRISSKLIMCFLRHLSENDAFQTLEDAKPYLQLIDGVGLDSSEVGHPPSKFKNVFQAAAKLNLLRVAHAGEEGPPDYVVEALDCLNIDRLDHGNRAMESAGLIERLKKEKITLTVCPLSNLKLGVVTDMRTHPVKEMLNQNLRITINSDDPSYFGGYVNDNFDALVKSSRISKDEIIQLAKNSFLGSFLTPKEQNDHLKDIDYYVASYHQR